VEEASLALMMETECFPDTLVPAYWTPHEILSTPQKIVATC
jgi:hypothetical protein